MQIDWITTIAQIINFLVLVYLLKRFLYRPIVNTMSRREAHIAQRLDEAAEQSAAAQQQTNTYNEKIRDLEQQKAQLLEDAKRDAEKQRTQLLDDMRGEITEIRTRWHQEVERERQAFLGQTRQMVGEQVCQVARQAFGDLADTELEKQILSIFLKKVTEIPEEDKVHLTETAVKKGLIVETRFPLTPEWREKITTIIHEQIDAAVAVHFEQAPGLICGISLRGLGFKLEWNLESYLAHIDEQLSGHLRVTSPGT